MIDFKQIEAFVWVAELEGFGAAADKLNTTQPAISQRIAAMESALTVRLFERNARGIRLTEKGQELLLHARRMLDMRNEMMRIAKAQNAMRGTLQLGVAETLVHTWLHELIECLHEKYPALILEIQVDTSHVLRSQLISHQIDLALLVGTSDEAKEHSLHLCDYPLAWVASPALKLHGRRISIIELAPYPVITYPSVSLPYRAVKTLLIEGGIKAPHIYGSASLSTIIHMARHGIGPSVVAAAVIAEEISQGELCVLDVNADLPDISFYACWMESPDSYTARAVARLAQDIANKSEVNAGHK